MSCDHLLSPSCYSNVPPPPPLLPPHQGLPPVLPPLPKRPALEKANGAPTIFNAGVFPYQQALANMQFQQQAAFIPSGKPPAPGVLKKKTKQNPERCLPAGVLALLVNG